MKKVIVFAAMALIAGFVQAATASWTITNVNASDGSGLSSGYTAYMFSYLTTDTAFKGNVTGALEAGSFADVVASATDSASTAGGKISQTGAGDYAASTSYNAFAVIFDSSDYASAKNYIVTKEVTKAVNALGGNIAFAFGTQASATWTTLPGGDTPTDVPEPTSGLLLLVGGAMLALRRKQK